MIFKLIYSNKRIWIEYLCVDMKLNYLDKLANQHDSNVSSKLAIDELIAWDEIEIDDETSEASSDKSENEQKDSTFKSKLNVPLVCSPTIQTVLYSTCQQLTKNLSYNMIE